MPKRILVTGATGFVGRYLVNDLIRAGHEVIAEWFELTDRKAVVEIVTDSKPDAVFHLAAQSMVAKSWEDPAGTVHVNTLGTLHLLEALAAMPSTMLVSIGSGDEYGLAGASGELLTEERLCQPQNPYSVSKYTAGVLSMQLARQKGLHVLHLRPFNHFGPGQLEGFVVSDFCSQIVKMEQGLLTPQLLVGDLSVERDFTDVRDVVAGYVRLIEKTPPTGIYNICSGQRRKVADILEFLLKQAKVQIDVQTDPTRFRCSDTPVFAGSAAKMVLATQWKPERDFYASLIETLDWWRKQ